MARNCLAKLQIIQGNYAEGYEMACDALTTVETVLGPAHPNVAKITETVTLAQQMESVTRFAAIMPPWVARYLALDSQYLSNIEDDFTISSSN
jgi:hypothetical protein